MVSGADSVPKVCALEGYLIDPDKWHDLYKKMPPECKKVVDDCDIEPDCIGIGRNEEHGWFIIGAGQGPCLLWSEKGKKL